MALMTFPFTQEQFLTIFTQYNLAVFPLQIVFIILGIIALWFIVKKNYRCQIELSCSFSSSSGSGWELCIISSSSLQ
jgi:hypothetical protein